METCATKILKHWKKWRRHQEMERHPHTFEVVGIIFWKWPCQMLSADPTYFPLKVPGRKTSNIHMEIQKMQDSKNNSE